jgi:hypothetical protein
VIILTGQSGTQVLSISSIQISLDFIVLLTLIMLHLKCVCVRKRQTDRSHPMLGEWRKEFHTFLTLSLGEHDWSATSCGHFIYVHTHSCKPVVPKRFQSTTPLVPYIHPQRPPTFFKKHKCAFVYTFILYLKNRLNKIIRVKLNVLCVN